MYASELKIILDKHTKWLQSEEGGEIADLSRADLYRADLRGADLTGANLSRAYAIISFGPVGEEKRIGYAWLDKDGKAVIKLGCHEGNLKDTAKAIQAKYGKKSTYEAVVRACVKELEAQK